MKSHQHHKCRCCQELFKPDFRNAHQQKYCSKPACRKASKRASNQKWLAKPENKNYHRGPEAVARVQAAQKLHPEYRARQKAKRQPALQATCIAQVLESTQENDTSSAPQQPLASPAKAALQDICITQPHVFIGLIAHFFGAELQDEIANIYHLLQKLGEDITNGSSPDEIIKANPLPRAATQRASQIQLGRSAIRAGASP